MGEIALPHRKGEGVPVQPSLEGFPNVIEDNDGVHLGSYERVRTTSGIIIMKALSLRQPYANWVADGSKTIETRGYRTKYRGDVVICASKSGDGEPKGVSLCIVDIYDVRPMTKEDEEAARVKYEPGKFAWLTRNPRVFENPFPVIGKIYMFDLEVPEENMVFKAA